MIQMYLEPDIEQQQSLPMQQNNNARRLYQHRLKGVFSLNSYLAETFSAAFELHFCHDALGQPLFLASEAERFSDALERDSRISLTLEQKQPDTGRLILFGCARKREQDSEASERFSLFFPHCLNQDHTDIALFRLVIVGVDYIDTCGNEIPLSPDQLSFPEPLSWRIEQRIITHMNQDHKKALKQYWRNSGIASQPVGSPTLVGIDPEGFYIRWSSKTARFTFPHAISTPDDVRREMVAMLRQQDIQGRVIDVSGGEQGELGLNPETR